MATICAGIGTTKESARASIDALGTTDPITNLQGNSISTGVPAPGEALIWNGATYVPGPVGGIGPYTVLSLAYDPSIPVSGNGVFKTWAELYSAYTTSKGPVDVYVSTSVQPDPGTYSFRPGTRIRGQFNQYDPPVQVTLFTGTVFEDVSWLDSIAIKGQGVTSGTMVWTDSYPSVRLENGAQLLGDSPTPLVQWNTPNSSSFLNFDLQSRAEIRNLSGVVIDLQGIGPGVDAAGVGFRLGQNTTMGANVFSSNADALVNLDVKDGTATVSFNQPGYTGQGSPLDPTQLPDLNFNTTLTVQNALTMGFPAGSGAPPWLQLVRNVQTTNATPTPIFPVQSPPPVISVGLNLQILARDAATGDSAFWILKGLVKFGAIAATGPLGLVVDFHDADPGAVTWGYSVVLNTPDPNNIVFNVIGEVGKTIEWSFVVLETLVLAF